MPRKDTTRPLDIQIEEYKLQFELAEGVRKDVAQIKERYLGLPSGSSINEIWAVQSAARSLGWKGNDWRWDPDWDGVLIDNCRKLEAAGFVVVQFWRKRKIMFKLGPKQIATRREIIERVCNAIGDNFDGIAFARGISVWWGPEKKRWPR